MKKSPILSFLVLSLLSFTLAAPLQAKDGDETPNHTEKTAKKTDKKSKNEAGGMVADAIKELEQDLFNAEVNPEARYFIYLYSASWCGPCCAEMPKIVKAYPELRMLGVEVLLIGQDKTVEDAKKYLKDFKAPFPGLHSSAFNKGKLPGMRGVPGFPWAILVDADGNELMHDLAKKVFAEWKNKIEVDPKLLKKAERERAKAERKAEKEKKKKKK